MPHVLRLTLALALMALSSAGCSNGGQSVTFTIELSEADGQGATPMSSAHVRAIALETNDVPLPVTLENLAKLDHPIASGLADAKGRARLTLRPEGAYLIEVNSPPFGPLADAGPWRFTLDADGRTLTPVGDPQSEVRVSTGRPR